MSNELTIPIDRITYRDGQLLTAQDLRDDHRRDNRLDRLHVRYFHETWGIALGFEISQPDDQDTKVIVGPGYAVDNEGHDILLAESLDIDVPNVIGPESFVLTLTYRDDDDFQDRTDLASLCLGDGLDPRLERPAFSWCRQDDVRFGPQVPLVQVVVASGIIEGGLDFRVRRYANRLARPHIAQGTYEATITSESLLNRIVKIKIDTSEAGFTHAPLYFLSAPQFSFRFPTIHAPIKIPVIGFDSVVDAQPYQVTYQLLLLMMETFSIIDLLETEILAATKIPPEEVLPTDPNTLIKMIGRGEVVVKLPVFWSGVEPLVGCEPELDFARLFRLSGSPVARTTIT